MKRANYDLFESGRGRVGRGKGTHSILDLRPDLSPLPNVSDSLQFFTASVVEKNHGKIRRTVAELSFVRPLL